LRFDDAAAKQASTSSCASARAMRWQLGEMCREQHEQLVVERFLQRQRAVACRKRLVFEFLQLRRDVAFGVLQRLSAAVVGRHFLRMSVGDLDVEAVNAVVGDAQVGNAGAAALARLERGEELARARLQRTQLIELLAVAVGDHAAVAHHRRGFLEHGPSQQREALHRDFQIVQHPREQRRAARNAGLISGSRARLSRNEERSRGRAFLSAMRPVMRSTSAKRRSNL